MMNRDALEYRITRWSLSSARRRRDPVAADDGNQPVEFVAPMATDIHRDHRYINPARHHVRVFGVGLQVLGLEVQE
jgi:hypothetical protein